MSDDTRIPGFRADVDAATATLLLVGHGSTRSTVARDTLDRHADALKAGGRFADVHAAMLRGAPKLEDVVGRCGAATLIVLPVFMSDGYLAQDELPRRLRETAGRTDRDVLLPPVGVGIALAPFLATTLAAAAEARDCAPRDSVALLVAHGNPNDPRSHQATEGQQAAVRSATAFADVRTAYIEEPPDIRQALAGVSKPVFAVGLFAADGKHAGGDVPAMLAGLTTPAVEWLGAIGSKPGFSDVLAAHVTATLTVRKG